MARISYRNLFIMMEEDGIKKYDLRKAGLSPNIINRLMHDEHCNTKTILFLCEMLKCQPGAIMEVIFDG